MFELWCNGNTADFGSVVPGSSPGSSTPFSRSGDPASGLRFVFGPELSIVLFALQAVGGLVDSLADFVGGLFRALLDVVAYLAGRVAHAVGSVFHAVFHLVGGLFGLVLAVGGLVEFVAELFFGLPVFPAVLRVVHCLDFLPFNMFSSSGDHRDDPQQNDSSGNRGQEAAQRAYGYPPEPREDPASQHTADQTYDQIDDEARAVALDDQVGDPSGRQTD